MCYFFFCLLAYLHALALVYSTVAGGRIFMDNRYDSSLLFISTIQKKVHCIFLELLALNGLTVVDLDLA